MSNAYNFIEALELAGTVEQGIRVQRSALAHLSAALLAHVGDERPQEALCAIEVGVAVLYEPRILAVRFRVDEWRLVELIVASARDGSLEISPLALKELGEPMAVGVCGHLGDALLMAATASKASENLLVRIGGFAHSARFGGCRSWS